MLKGNKGEWSELWAFLKSLDLGAIDLSDKYLLPIPGEKLLLNKIFREGVVIDLSSKSDFQLTLPTGQLISVSKSMLSSDLSKFFDEISNAKANSFNCFTGEQLLKLFRQSKLKAPSANKKDIEIEIFDPKILFPKKVGFSIKSKLGAPATLLNASKDNTNFTFEVRGGQLQVSDINNIQSKNKVQDRITAIQRAGGTFVFSHCKGPIFAQNLIKIDSQMPEILAWATLINLQLTLPKKKLVDVLCHNWFDQKMRNLKIPLDLKSVEYKFKHFLCAVALGMVPKSTWSGLIDADGGYLVVKHNGDVVCFHVYNLGEFQEYLLTNVKFDTPSTSRHNFGEIYRKDNKIFFDVNCQIRFAN